MSAHVQIARPLAHHKTIAVRLAFAVSLLAMASPVISDMAVSLTGTVTPTGISGFAGTPFTLGIPDGIRAVYGIWSVERNDKPCYVATMTEDVNDSKDDSGAIKSLCGGDPTSSEMKVQFGEIKFAGAKLMTKEMYPTCLSGIRMHPVHRGFRH
ncbi:MAG TPA: hypothetical protein VFS89_02115 [Nitrosospira sp.]|nr:hypothetical protein [Nitrosospira sp.]